MDKLGDILGISTNNLIKNEHLFKTLVELSDNGIAVINLVKNLSDPDEGLIIHFANQAFRQLFPEMVAGSNFFDVIAHFKSADWLRSCLSALNINELFEDRLKLNIAGSGGEFRFVASKVSENRLLVVLKEDKSKVSDIRKHEIINQQSEKVANLGSWEYDKENGSMSWSDGMYDMFGLDRNTPVSVEKYLDYTNPENESLVSQFISRIKTGDSTFEEDISFYVKGQNKVVHVRSTPIIDENGKVKKMIGVDLDVTDKLISEKELREQHYFIQQTCEASPVLIAIFNLSKQAYTYLSKDVYPFVGYSSEQLLAAQGEQLYALIEPEDKERVLAFYNNFEGFGDNDIREIEYCVKASDGSCRWLGVRAKVFKRDTDANVSELICSIQDHTQRKQAEEKIKENELMQLLLAEKDEFISVASHELRTPITSVKASLQILKRLIEPAEKGGTVSLFLHKSIEQINKLATLTNDLLDITKMHANKINLNFTVFSLDSFFADAVDEHHEGFDIIVSNSVTHPVKADRNRMEQVLRNFLSNAAKYSPMANKIVVEAEEVDNYVRVSVTDFGIGIPKAKQPFVFDRYYRVNDKATQYSGLGLGLYICAEIIKMHGGDYGVESDEGRGSTFWFSIPIYEEPHAV